MPLNMGIMKMNLFRGVKIAFIGILVVSLLSFLRPEREEH